MKRAVLQLLAQETRPRAHIYIYIYIYIYVCIHIIYIYIYTYISYIYIYIYKYICDSLSLSIYVHIYTYTHIHIHTFTYACIHSTPRRLPARLRTPPVSGSSRRLRFSPVFGCDIHTHADAQGSFVEEMGTVGSLCRALFGRGMGMNITAQVSLCAFKTCLGRFSQGFHRLLPGRALGADCLGEACWSRHTLTDLVLTRFLQTWRTM